MKNHFNKLIYWLLLILLLEISFQGASQVASISYPFAVGLTGCQSGTAQIHFYKYNSITNNISSIAATSGATSRYIPQLRIGSNNTQRFSFSRASVSYNPRDKNIYYLWSSNFSGSWRTYTWRWSIGTQPTITNPS